jgi:hypothetical protein
MNTVACKIGFLAIFGSKTYKTNQNSVKATVNKIALFQAFIP